MCQRTNISSRRALDDKARDSAFDLEQLVFEQLDLDAFQLYWLLPASQFVGGAPMHFFRGKRRRRLFEASDVLRSQIFQNRRIQYRRGIWSLHLTFGIVGISA